MIVLSFIIVPRLIKGNVDGSHALSAWLIPGVATLDIAVAGGTMPMPWAHELNLFAAARWAISFPITALASAALKYAAFADTWVLVAIAALILMILSVAIAVLFVRTLHILSTESCLPVKPLFPEEVGAGASKV